MADYGSVLADLKARLAALDQERCDIAAVIAGVERQARQPMTGVSPLAFAGLTMPQALMKCLTLAHEPQTPRQCQDTLRAGGMKTSKRFHASVYNTLHRLSGPGGPFRHESYGRWSLREWGSGSDPLPGMACCGQPDRHGVVCGESAMGRAGAPDQRTRSHRAHRAFTTVTRPLAPS